MRTCRALLTNVKRQDNNLKYLGISGLRAFTKTTQYGKLFQQVILLLLIISVFIVSDPMIANRGDHKYSRNDSLYFQLEKLVQSFMLKYLEAIGCSRIEGVPTLQLNMESCRWVIEDQPGIVIKNLGHDLVLINICFGCKNASVDKQVDTCQVDNWIIARQDKRDKII